MRQRCETREVPVADVRVKDDHIVAALDHHCTWRDARGDVAQHRKTHFEHRGSRQRTDGKGRKDLAAHTVLRRALGVAAGMYQQVLEFAHFVLVLLTQIV